MKLFLFYLLVALSKTKWSIDEGFAFKYFNSYPLYIYNMKRFKNTVFSPVKYIQRTKIEQDIDKTDKH